MSMTLFGNQWHLTRTTLRLKAMMMVSIKRVLRSTLTWAVECNGTGVELGVRLVYYYTNQRNTKEYSISWLVRIDCVSFQKWRYLSHQKDASARLFFYSFYTALPIYLTLFDLSIGRTVMMMSSPSGPLTHCLRRCIIMARSFFQKICSTVNRMWFRLTEQTKWCEIQVVSYIFLFYCQMKTGIVHPFKFRFSS